MSSDKRPSDKAFDVLKLLNRSLAKKLKKDLAPIANFTADCLCFFETGEQNAVNIFLHFCNNAFLGHCFNKEVGGKWLFENIVEDDLPAFQRILRKIEYGSAAITEIKIRDINGAPRLCRFTAKPVWNDEENMVIAGIIAINEAPLHQNSDGSLFSRKKTIIDSVLSNFILTGNEGTIISYSGNIKSLFGLKKNQSPIGKNIAAFLKSPFCDYPICKQKDYAEFEVKPNSESVSERWLQLCVFAVEKSSSSRGDRIIIVRDVTSSRLTHQALADSEEKFRTLAENCPAAIFLEVDQRMVYISSQAEQITGYSPEQLLAPDFDFHQVFDNLQLNENESVLQHFFKISNASLHMKVDVNCLSGKKRNCCLAVQTMPFQGRKAYLGIISDLTDFQAVNKKLDETKERYWALFEASSDAIFIETLDGTILDCNSAVEKLYGYKKDELLGMTARDLVPGNYSESLKAVAEELSQAESAGKTLQIMATGKKKDGTIFPTEVLVNELKIDNDDLFLVTIRDISLRKELESARKKYDGQMQQIQLLDSFTNVVSGLANDFNNILTGIMGYSDLIMREISPNSPIREKNRRIQEAARKGADIINQLIASTGKLPANFKKADLKTLIRDIIGQLTARVEAKGPLTCVVDKNLPEIVFDSSQIKLALNNLVLNAFEATDKKGHFSIQVAAGKQSYSGDEPGYFGPPFKSGSYVSIKVSDQGCGISAEVFNQIFEPFFSTCNSRRGLGLSTVLGIVRSHRGAIFIKSEVQTGTEIQLLLPVRNFKFCEDNSEFEIENGEILEDFPAGNALIIDDEQSVLDLICEQLKNLGFNTFTAINGKQGIELFKLHNHCLDIVVLDLALPGKTGFEVFQEFEWLNPKIPVIICTGMVEFSQELKHCNNCVILNKPFQSSDLEKALFKARTLK